MFFFHSEGLKSLAETTTLDTEKTICLKPIHLPLKKLTSQVILSAHNSSGIYSVSKKFPTYSLIISLESIIFQEILLQNF